MVVTGFVLTIETVEFCNKNGASINGGMAETAEMVGFQFVMFIGTLIIYEFLYSTIIG